MLAKVELKTEERVVLTATCMMGCVDVPIVHALNVIDAIL